MNRYYNYIIKIKGLDKLTSFALDFSFFLMSPIWGSHQVLVVFFIIFEKEFVFIPLKGRHVQSNNRVLSLLNKLDLTDRVLFADRTFKQIEKNRIDYAKVNHKLDRFRNESIRFLMDSLITK